MSVYLFKKLRELLGYSQTEMAKVWGTSKQNWKRLEDKSKTLNRRDVKKIRVLAREADLSDREILDLIEMEGELVINKTSRKR